MLGKVFQIFHWSIQVTFKCKQFATFFFLPLESNTTLKDCCLPTLPVLVSVSVFILFAYYHNKLSHYIVALRRSSICYLFHWCYAYGTTQLSTYIYTSYSHWKKKKKKSKYRLPTACARPSLLHAFISCQRMML